MNRDQFEIAIICPLRCEYDAVELLLDDRDNSNHLGRAPGDLNIYTTGRMGDHLVVLVRLAKIGNSTAAGAAASLRSSFPSLSLVLVTGVCGGVSSKSTEILLGDVIVSKTVVQYDLGRQFPDHFEIAETMDSALAGVPKAVANFVATLETGSECDELQERAAGFMRAIQDKDKNAVYQYPGAGQDRLFEANYRHKHRPSASCNECDKCRSNLDPICDEARNSSCNDLQCDVVHLVKWRKRHAKLERLAHQGKLEEAQQREILFGCIASANKVLMSGAERDELAEKLSKRSGFPVLAFEMEGAGVWDELPCLVVKSVCDYADSHKNKGWQNFASAMAACVTRAIVERFPRKAGQPGTTVQEDIEPRAAVNGAVYRGSVSGKNIVSNVMGDHGTYSMTFS